jgi:hypothetical protein
MEYIIFWFTPGRGFDHPPPSSAEVEGRVELYFYSPSGPSCPVIGWTVNFTLMIYDNLMRKHMGILTTKNLIIYIYIYIYISSGLTSINLKFPQTHFIYLEWTRLLGHERDWIFYVLPNECCSNWIVHIMLGNSVQIIDATEYLTL